MESSDVDEIRDAILELAKATRGIGSIGGDIEEHGMFVGESIERGLLAIAKAIEQRR